MFILSLSCTENTVDYNHWILEKTDNKEDNKKREDIRIGFDADIDNFNTRTSSSLLNANRYAIIYVFNTIYSTTQNRYFTKVAGTLTPVDTALYLVDGNYNFYAACINEENVAVPAFTYGLYDDLENNVDYLWWGGYDLKPQYPSTNYNISFSHVFTQVVLKLSISKMFPIKQFNYISLTPSSLDTLSWNLYYGNVGPASKVDTAYYNLSYSLTNDTIYYSQLTMAPIKVETTTDLMLKFQLVLTDDSSLRTYYAALPIYQNYLEAGHSYQYEVELLADTLLFNGVTISSWKDVNVDKSPIIPSGEN